MQPIIIATDYRGHDCIGDFEWMIKQNVYPDGLYLYYDNVEEFCTAYRGCGNLAIRPYNIHSLSYSHRPLSAGIPIESRHNGGFKTLTKQAKAHIDLAFDDINKLIDDHHYKHIIFSTIDAKKHSVGKDVIEYITKKIYKLGATNTILT